MESQEIFRGCVGMFLDCGISRGQLEILKRRFAEKCGTNGHTVTEVTHVIAGNAETVEKMFDAYPGLLAEMREQKHFLTFEWVTACLTEGKKVKELAFSLFPDPRVDVTKARAREAAEQEEKDKRELAKIIGALRRANPRTP